MGKKNAKVDAYIAKAAPFAKPILKRLRASIHQACPQAVEEIKWGAPFFLYRERVLCATMAFKAHCAVVFWKSALIVKKKGERAKADLKQLRRISQKEELPSEAVLRGYLKLAMHFNEPTTKLPPRAQRSAPLAVPTDLDYALKANPKALKTFDAFPPSKKKDYILWISGAKTETTRERRLEQAIDWMKEGKPRNWKYELAKKKAR